MFRCYTLIVSRDDKIGSTRWIGPPNLQKIIGWVDIFGPSKFFGPPNPRALVGGVGWPARPNVALFFF